jgi:1-acyl-sn-glycerol-3-phosphate acyltransferase
LERRVLKLVEQLAPRAEGQPVAADTSLSAIGFDSLSYAELGAALQEELGMRLADLQVRGTETVGDVMSKVNAAVVPASPGERERLPAGIGRFQRTSRALAGPVLRWWLHVEVRGAERMPASGPVVLCMNHESFLDIPLAVIASPRPITFMAKRELYRSRAGALLLHELGGFPVDRDSFDVQAVRWALAVIDSGEVLGMYPEGTRRPGVLLPFLRGAAWLALRTGATLLPAAINGSEASMPPGRNLPRRVPVTFSFGEPVEVDVVDDPPKRRAEAERLTSHVRAAVEDLLAADRRS